MLADANIYQVIHDSEGGAADFVDSSVRDDTASASYYARSSPVSLK